MPIEGDVNWNYWLLEASIRRPWRERLFGGRRAREEADKHLGGFMRIVRSVFAEEERKGTVANVAWFDPDDHDPRECTLTTYLERLLKDKIRRKP